MKDCQTYSALVPGYADGELSEEQAAPLRQHLLSCNTCRNEVQELGRVSRWFPDQGAPAVPAGFAARVAAAAFAGEQPGLRRAAPRPSAAAPAEQPSEEPRVLAFVLTLTSVAAGVLLTMALLLAQKGEPQGQSLSAEPLPTILQELDRLNGVIKDEPGR